MSQIDLRYDMLFRFREARDRIYLAMQSAASKVPFDHILIDTDAKQSSLSHGLKRENGHRSHIDTAAYLLVRPESSAQLLDDINALCDMRAVPRELTATEKVVRYEAAFLRAGAAGDAIRRDALTGAR